jgi:F-type H+-transporting ATPase subunit b
MLPSLFFAAAVEAPAAVASAAAHAGAEPSIAEQFGLEWKYVLIQAVSFIILFVVLYWKAIKPIIAAMDERAQKIDAGLKYAEEMRAQLASTQQQTEAALKEAQLKAQAIVAETQKSSKEFAEKQQKAAIETAASLISKAQEAIELEKKKMLAEARTEIARLVVATTERVLAKKLTDADRASYNESAARELAGV